MTAQEQEIVTDLKHPVASKVNVEIGIDKLHPSPYQMRVRAYEKRKERQEEEERDALSMEKVGLIESLMVRPLPRKDGEYEIISGHRRWEIAKKKGWKTIRCDVYTDLDEDTVMYLVGSHNFLRVQIYPYEKGKYFQFWRKRMPIEDVAALFGYSDTTIRRWLFVADGIDKITLPFTEREKERFLERLDDELLDVLLEVETEADLKKASRMLIEQNEKTGQPYTLEEIKAWVAKSVATSRTSITGEAESQRGQPRTTVESVEELAQKFNKALKATHQELLSKSHDKEWVQQTLTPLQEVKDQLLEEVRTQDELLNKEAKALKVKKPGELRVKHVSLGKNRGKCIHLGEDGRPIGTILFTLK